MVRVFFPRLICCRLSVRKSGIRWLMGHVVLKPDLKSTHQKYEDVKPDQIQADNSKCHKYLHLFVQKSIRKDFQIIYFETWKMSFCGKRITSCGANSPVDPCDGYTSKWYMFTAHGSILTNNKGEDKLSTASVYLFRHIYCCWMSRQRSDLWTISSVQVVIKTKPLNPSVSNAHITCLKHPCTRTARSDSSVP